jgi:hypothetical protein
VIDGLKSVSCPQPLSSLKRLSSSRREPLVDWVEQHWFFGYGITPFRRTKESRALRRDLDGVLCEFCRGEVNGPIARRLIAAIEKETARQREIRDARLAKPARRRVPAPGEKAVVVQFD